MKDLPSQAFSISWLQSYGDLSGSSDQDSDIEVFINKAMENPEARVGDCGDSVHGAAKERSLRVHEGHRVIIDALAILTPTLLYVRKFTLHTSIRKPLIVVFYSRYLLYWLV